MHSGRRRSCPLGRCVRFLLSVGAPASADDAGTAALRFVADILLIVLAAISLFDRARNCHLFLLFSYSFLDDLQRVLNYLMYIRNEGRPLASRLLMGVHGSPDGLIQSITGTRLHAAYFVFQLGPAQFIGRAIQSELGQGTDDSYIASHIPECGIMDPRTRRCFAKAMSCPSSPRFHQ
jgi:hypothetical protein